MNKIKKRKAKNSKFIHIKDIIPGVLKSIKENRQKIKTLDEKKWKN